MERVQNRRAVRRYYQSHASDIIRHKTLKHVATSGRVPRQTTLERHRMDPTLVARLLREYVQKHPDASAAPRICEFLTKFE